MIPKADQPLGKAFQTEVVVCFYFEVWITLPKG